MGAERGRFDCIAGFVAVLRKTDTRSSVRNPADYPALFAFPARFPKRRIIGVTVRLGCCQKLRRQALAKERPAPRTRPRYEIGLDFCRVNEGYDLEGFGEPSVGRKHDVANGAHWKHPTTGLID